MNEALKNLRGAIDEYKSYIGSDEKAYAILYTPQDCHLVLVDGSGTFFNHHGAFTPQNVFEARIFNKNAELRWLNQSNGKGKIAVLTNKSFASDLNPIPQTYLLWGEEVQSVANPHPKGWTKFGTVRIGSYYVPITLESKHSHARFTAVEYLKKYEDGNVAVVDELLTGIESYDGGQNNG